MSKFEKIVYGVCTLVELGGIIGITAIALKRNQECYEAQCENVELSCALIQKDIDMLGKDVDIRKLQQEVKDLKEKYESNEEEA